MIYIGIRISRCVKEELAWVTDKWLHVISIGMLFKTVIYATKELKSKAILCLNNIVCAAMWLLVTDSNCFIIYYVPTDTAGFYH